MPKQYLAIKRSLLKRGYTLERAKRIAAATWNKLHPKRPNPWLKEKRVRNRIRRALARAKRRR